MSADVRFRGRAVDGSHTAISRAVDLILVVEAVADL